jgi:hypothetical protein
MITSFLKLRKDGGPESRVDGFFIIEIKRWFSVVLLHFLSGSRDAYHSHAFDAVSWVLRGQLIENELSGTTNTYRPSFRPVVTRRATFHKVVSVGDTYVLSFRGPWVRFWREYDPGKKLFTTLTHGRKVASA